MYRKRVCKALCALHTLFLYGDGGIRTLVARRPNAFRVRPVMTASIRLQSLWKFQQTASNYRIIEADSSNPFLSFLVLSCDIVIVWICRKRYTNVNVIVRILVIFFENVMHRGAAEWLASFALPRFGAWPGGTYTWGISSNSLLRILKG